MLKYLPLLWSNLGRKRIRTVLTLASIVIAFLLFGLLQTMKAALTGGADLAGVDRLMTLHKVSLIQPLPASYLNRVRGVEGVKVAMSQDWFGGLYQDDRNQLAAFAVEPELFFEVYPEYSLPEDQKAAWIADRTGIIVGKTIAERFGWKVGDRIALRSNIFTNKNGSTAWEFNVSGIYTATNGDLQSVYFHYKYFNESRQFGEDTIGYIVMRIEDPDRAPRSPARSMRCSRTPRPRRRPRPRKPSSRVLRISSATSARSSRGSRAPCSSRCCSSSRTRWGSRSASASTRSG